MLQRLPVELLLEILDKLDQRSLQSLAQTSSLFSKLVHQTLTAPSNHPLLTATRLPRTCHLLKPETWLALGPHGIREWLRKMSQSKYELPLNLAPDYQHLLVELIRGVLDVRNDVAFQAVSTFLVSFLYRSLSLLLFTVILSKDADMHFHVKTLLFRCFSDCSLLTADLQLCKKLVAALFWIQKEKHSRDMHALVEECFMTLVDLFEIDEFDVSPEHAMTLKKFLNIVESEAGKVRSLISSEQQQQQQDRGEQYEYRLGAPFKVSLLLGARLATKYPLAFDHRDLARITYDVFLLDEYGFEQEGIHDLIELLLESVIESYSVHDQVVVRFRGLMKVLAQRTPRRADGGNGQVGQFEQEADEFVGRVEDAGYFEFVRETMDRLFHCPTAV